VVQNSFYFSFIVTSNMNLKRIIAEYPNFPKKGILFRDFSPILSDASAMSFVVDVDFQELENFTLGIRIFYHGEQVDAIMPTSYQNGHVEMDYIFENSGNHVFRVDLYDLAKDGGILTYTFNISAQNPFGYIFISAVTMGGTMTAIIFIYVYLSKRRSKSKV